MKTAERPTDVTSRVRRQYERLPYPRRDPADEAKRLLQTSLDDLGLVNQYCFRGRRDFGTGFRVLVAGGGTGDAVVYLAHQLRHTDAEIVYVDLSQASLAVARSRCAARGLDRRVTWLNGSLLDLPAMGLGRFDYVNCSGVLHHLESPEAGLAALREVLAADGAIGLMVYARYGRTAVYQMQELFRLAVPEAADGDDAAEVVRKALSHLPPTNWLALSGGVAGVTRVDTDEELYDLFLHSRDRAYSVPELYAFAAGAGLHVVEFTMESRALYEPRSVAPNWPLLPLVEKLPVLRRRAVGEILCGSITKHLCWLSPREDSRLDVFDADNVPAFSHLADSIGVRASLAKAQGTWSLRFDLGGRAAVSVACEMTPDARRFVGLIDGRRTLADLLLAVVGDGAGPERVRDAWAECRRLVAALAEFDLLWFRHASTPPLRAA
ncbi:MAG TPA: class I SAM-dependent methyltransferase [Planctomycetaceae bacterium]